MINISILNTDDICEYTINGYIKNSVGICNIKLLDKDVAIFNEFYKLQPDYLVVSANNITPEIHRCIQKYDTTKIIDPSIFIPGVDPTPIQKLDRNFYSVFASLNLESMCFLQTIQDRPYRLFSKDNFPIYNYVGYPKYDTLSTIFNTSHTIVDTSKKITHIMLNAIYNNCELITIEKISLNNMKIEDFFYANMLTDILDRIEDAK